jgi:hypothetical protein
MMIKGDVQPKLFAADTLTAAPRDWPSMTAGLTGGFG